MPDVQASLAAVTLADDCPDAKTPPSGDCAGTDTCRSLCQQSNLQIDLSSSGGSSEAPFEIVEVRVIDERSSVATVIARTPQRWDGSAYVSWDELISPNATIKTSYKISNLMWSTINDAPLRAETYRVEVDVMIGGEVRTISLDGVTREPDVQT
jgi:hypothetical protein